MTILKRFHPALFAELNIDTLQELECAIAYSYRLDRENIELENYYCLLGKELRRRNVSSKAPQKLEIVTVFDDSELDAQRAEIAQKGIGKRAWETSNKRSL